MFWSTGNILELSIQAQDGEIGRCKDLLVDDRYWYVRYLVADTRKWLPGRDVLISPIALGKLELGRAKIPVKMTRDQIESSPPLEEDAPVSRRYERQYFDHFGWPPYWSGLEPWGEVPYPDMAFNMQQKFRDEEEEDPEKSHLRSLKELTGYSVTAQGEDIGALHECMVNVRRWVIRYLIVDISKWYELKGRKVLIIPQCITDIDWRQKVISTSIAAQEVKNCPQYDLESPLERDFELVLHDYYGWPKYWENVNR